MHRVFGGKCHNLSKRCFLTHNVVQNIPAIFSALYTLLSISVAKVRLPRLLTDTKIPGLRDCALKNVFQNLNTE